MLYILSYDRLLLGTASTSCPKRSFRSPLTLLSAWRIIHPFQLFSFCLHVLQLHWPISYTFGKNKSALLFSCDCKMWWIFSITYGELTFKNSDIHKSMSSVLLALQLCRIFMAHVCCVQVFAASRHLKRFVTVNRGSFISSVVQMTGCSWMCFVQIPNFSSCSFCWIS